MSEKYQAQHNGVETLEKTKKQEREESSAKVAKTATKAAASYFAPGVGGTIVDMAANTKVGQKVFDTAGKVIAKNPTLGRASKKLDDAGAVDLADKGLDFVNPGSAAGGVAKGAVSSTASTVSNAGTQAVKGNAKNTISQSTQNSMPVSSSNSTSSTSTNGNGLDNENQVSKKNNLLDSPFANGGFDISKVIKTKYLIAGCGVFFGFVLLMTTIVSAKDMGNLDITNTSTAMGDYVPESLNPVAPGSISLIDDTSIDGEGGSILSGGKTIESLLGAEGVRLLNQSISSSAASAGYGTGAAPAAAAQALIQNLLNNNIIIPYFWGGGHGSIANGVNPNWGQYQYVSAGGHSTSYSNQPAGLDCSGFVSWALYNGGCKNFSPITARNFKNLGPSISFSSAKTGDIAASNGHVVLILENRGSSLLCAEAKGTKYGVIFTERNEKELKSYTIVDMSSYYQTNCA